MKTLFEDVSTEESLALADVQSGEMVDWSDEKKKDFVKTFKERAHVSRKLLVQIAYEIMEAGERRKFISYKHTRDLPSEVRGAGYNSWYGCGRSRESLDRIVKERTDSVINELPPLKKAVQLIDADTAKLIEQTEKLKAKGQKLTDKLDEISEPIVMADLDQKMTIGAFRVQVKKQTKQRDTLVRQIREIANEGDELERTVAKRLYAGLPGLSEAVVSVITAHVDRANALDTLTRRVEEAVMFGDSKVALNLLQHFEEDEPVVGETVRKQFKDALQKLKLSRKQLRKGRK